jgi:YD repeat-containing protein
MANAGIKPWWNYKSFTLKGDAAHRLAVNTGNGNLVVSVVDFVFPCRVPAVAMRTYNSANLATAGLLGYGWRLGWEECLTSVSTVADTTYIDPTGAEYLFTFSAGHWTKPAGTFSELTYSGGKFTLTAPDGFRREFSATPGVNAGKLLSLIDANGNRLDFTWDATWGYLTKIKSPDSGGPVPVTIVDDFTYNSSHRLTSFGIALSGGRTCYFTYDYDVPTGNYLASATDPVTASAQTWQYGYPVLAGSLGLITDPRGNATGISYSSSKVAQVTDPTSAYTTFAYNSPATDKTTITDRRTNATVVLHHSTDLYPEKIWLPGITEPVELDWNGTTLLLEGVEDPLDHATAYTYDSYGNVLSVTDAEAHVTDYTYDSTYHSLLSVKTYRDGTHETVFDYGSTAPEKARRNVLTITNPIDTEVTAFQYNANGDCTQTTDPALQRTVRAYDPVYGVCLSVSAIFDNGSGASQYLTTSFTYDDAALWLLSTTNPEGLLVTYERDEIGRPTDIHRWYTGADPPQSIDVAYGYDECGNIETYTDANGKVTTYGYDSRNLLANLKLPETPDTTYTSEYTYDAEENPYQVLRYADASSTYTTTYHYDALNRLDHVTLPEVLLAGSPENPELRYVYDAASRCTHKAARAWSGSGDAAWIVTLYDYYANNQLFTETGPFYANTYNPGAAPTDPPTPQVEYAYNTDNTLLTLTGRPLMDAPPADRVYTYAYDDDSRLTAVTEPDLTDPATDGGITEYAYYPNSQLKSVRLPRQQREDGPAARSYTYDSIGRTSAVADALGYAQRYTYFKDGRAESITDAAGSRTTYSYDGYGRLLQTTQELGAYALNEYHATGDQLDAITGPNNFRTEFSYDDRGRVETSTQVVHGTPDVGLVTTYSYDQLDRMTFVNSPRDSTNAYTYDGMSRLVDAVIDTDDGMYDGFKYEFEFGYDLCGRLLKRTNPDAGEQTYAYDAGGRVTTLTDPEGYTATASYDPWGMLARNDFADGGFSAFTYDELGRQTTQTNALDEEYAFSYDLNGNNTRLVTPYGSTTEFSYNERDELVKTVAYATDDPRGPHSLNAKIELFTYNPAGQLLTYTGPGNEQWTFGYDAQGRWTNVRNSLGQTCTRSYNANNCLGDVRDLEGRHYTLSYDSLNRRTNSTYNPGGEGETPTDFSWTGLDLTQVVEGPDAARTTDMLYDRLGRLTSSTLTVGEADPLETVYEYNWRGQVSKRTLPAYVDGFSEIEDYTYDLRGLLTNIHYDSSDNAVAIRYDQCGRQAGMTFPGGARRSLYYNLAGRLIADSMTCVASGELERSGWQTYYGYDRAGNRVAQTRDRFFPSLPDVTLPFYVPQDEAGNPVVPLRETTSGAGPRTWDAIPVNGSTAPQAYTLSWGEPATDEQSIAATNNGTAEVVSAATAVYTSGLDQTALQPVFRGTILPAYPEVEGAQSLLPQAGAGLQEPQIERRRQDALYNLQDVGSQQQFQSGIGLQTGQQQDNGNTGLSANGLPLVQSEARRAEVQTALAFNAVVVNTQVGAVPQLTSPWTEAIGGAGQLPRLTVVTEQEAE